MPAQDNAESSTIAGGGQRPGVAVDQYDIPVSYKLSAELAQLPRGLLLFSVYLHRLGHQCRLYFVYVITGLGHLLHALERPEKVAGGGAGGSNSAHHLIELLSKTGFRLRFDFQCPQGNSVSSNYPDGRSASYFQFCDG